MSRRAKDPPAPRSATLDGFLKAVHSDTVALFLKEAESSTAIQFSRRAAEKHLAIVEEAKGILRDLPAVLPAFPAGERLAAVEEAEAAILAAPDIPKPSEEERREAAFLAALEKANPERARQYREEHPAPEPAKESPLVSEERSRAIVHAIRVVFDSLGEVVDALEARAAAARERAAHAREGRAAKRATLKAAPENVQREIAEAVERAKAVKGSMEDKAFEVLKGAATPLLEPFVNTIPRGCVSRPQILFPAPGNIIGFDGAENTLTGSEKLGPVERQVLRAILRQAQHQNPADLVGVNIAAYAEANGINYSTARGQIENAVDSLFKFFLQFGESRERNSPRRIRLVVSDYGINDQLAEGCYLVRLSPEAATFCAQGKPVQLPLDLGISFKANPHADLFIQLFAMNVELNLEDRNENILGVDRLARAAGLLKGSEADTAHLFRVKEAVERDLKAAEKCGSEKIPAPFKSHHYRRDGVRLSTAKALALPFKEWLKLTVEVEWNAGALDYSKRRAAIRAARERRAVAEAQAKARAKFKKNSKAN